MISKLFILVLLTCITSVYSFDESLLRKKFYISVESSKEAKIFIKELENSSDKNPLINGYKAATIMVMAKHVFNPFSKFKYFIDGKKILENEIQEFPNNIELRLIRFAIQTNVPTFLGYSKEINSDKLFLLKNYSKLDEKSSSDSQLKQIIKKYLQESKKCDDKELTILN